MESHKKHLGFLKPNATHNRIFRKLPWNCHLWISSPETSKETDQVLNLMPFQHLWVNIQRSVASSEKNKQTKGPQKPETEIFRRLQSKISTSQRLDPTPRTNVPCTSDLLSSWHDKYADLHGSLPRGEGTVLVASIRDRIDPVFLAGTNDLIFRQICLILDFWVGGLFF